MTIYIEDERTESLVEELTRRTGESPAEAIAVATEERLGRLPAKTGRIDQERLRKVLARLDALPDLDDRTPDEILGYDRHGLP